MLLVNSTLKILVSDIAMLIGAAFAICLLSLGLRLVLSPYGFGVLVFTGTSYLIWRYRIRCIATVEKVRRELRPFFSFPKPETSGDKDGIQLLLTVLGIQVSQSYAYAASAGIHGLDGTDGSNARALAYGLGPWVFVTVFFLAFCVFIYTVPSCRVGTERDYFVCQFDYATRMFAMKTFTCGLLVAIYAVFAAANPEYNGLVSGVKTRNVDEEGNVTGKRQWSYFFEYTGTGADITINVTLKEEFQPLYQLADEVYLFAGPRREVEIEFKQASQNFTNQLVSGKAPQISLTEELSQREVRPALPNDQGRNPASVGDKFTRFEPEIAPVKLTVNHEQSVSDARYTLVVSVVEREGAKSAGRGEVDLELREPLRFEMIEK